MSNSLARNVVNILRSLATFSSLGSLGKDELEKLRNACQIVSDRCAKIQRRRGK